MKDRHVGILVPRLSRYGGMEQFAWSLSQALAGVCRVTCVCSRADDAPPGVDILPVARPRLGRFGKTLWFALRAEQIRRAAGFDCTIGLDNTLCQDILRISGGPTATFWRLSSRAWSPGPSRIWKSVRRRVNPGHALAMAIERIQLKRSTVKVANSHLVRDWTVAAHPWLSPSDFEVVYNRPDLARFTPATYLQCRQSRSAMGLSPEGRVVGLAGTNFMLKGLPQALSMLTFLPAEIRLAVAGGRNPSRFQAIARSLGVEDRVHFLGRVRRMPTFYHACEAFILPTLYDACSNAVLEALACGLPTVSTSCNGSSVFLDPDLIVPDPMDIPSLARAVSKALERPLGQPFSWPEHLVAGLDPFLNIVERVAQGKQPCAV
ncbi:MAG: glycosyltransferase [Deltaproteobacteria bacterium]|nr:glycosyltransferase [Deltaproteobacteria bacterium]